MFIHTHISWLYVLWACENIRWIWFLWESFMPQICADCWNCPLSAVLPVVNHRGPEAVRYTPPWRVGSGLRRSPEYLGLATYFHSSPDAVYFENIPIFMAGHRSRFKVLPLCISPHLSCLVCTGDLIKTALKKKRKAGAISDIFGLKLAIADILCQCSFASNSSVLQPKNTVFSFEFYSWQGGKASALTEKHGKLLDALDGV